MFFIRCAERHRFNRSRRIPSDLIYVPTDQVQEKLFKILWTKKAWRVISRKYLVYRRCICGLTREYCGYFWEGESREFIDL